MNKRMDIEDLAIPGISNLASVWRHWDKNTKEGSIIV